ncbi:hypothetical protein AKJ58_00655, partial [candidate division MSBL1 archaeon SCGC-AAA385D11]
REGGADICGIYKIPSKFRKDLFGYSPFCIRVVLQAKKESIDSPDVELFSKQVDNLQRACQTGDMSISRIAQRLPNSFTKFSFPQVPIVPLMFTAGRPSGLDLFTNISEAEGAVETARNSAIMWRNIDQLATDFINLAGMWFDETNCFKRELFLEQFSKMSGYNGSRENVEKTIFTSPPFA